MSEPTLDERFSELRRSVDGEIARARREAIAELACAMSRIRAASNESEWSAAVLESGRPFAEDSSALGLLAAVAALTAPSVARTPSLARTPTDALPPPNPGALPSSNPRALRFAKVKIAEMRLYQASAVENGRTARDLYGSLKPHIDAAREAFREKFLTAGNGTVDYLHHELVRALANDDITLLGPGYPGPLA